MSKAKQKKRKQTKAQSNARPTPAVADLEGLRGAELVSVPQFSLIEPAFTQASIRWLLFHREKNGLLQSGAVVQLGRRVLLRPKLFRAWIDAQGTGRDKVAA